MIRALIAFFALLWMAQPLYAVAVDEKPLDDPKLEAMARELMKDIRCLVCQNQSIEDSNADLAKDLRAVVRERIALGDTPENVRSYLVDRYGDWVLLAPPVKASTYLLWASPFLFLLVIAVMVVRSRKPARQVQPLSAEEEARVKAILEGKETEG